MLWDYFKMKVSVLTSHCLRHEYLLKKISSRFNVFEIFKERKNDKFNHLNYAKKKGDKFLVQHMEEFEKTEQKYLLDYVTKKDISKNSKIYQCKKGGINDIEITKKVINSDADIFVVYGTSLLKEEMLKSKKPFINIHLGLSPYYKGMACSVWPFYNNEPEYNGVTVLNLDKGIDSGNIIHQRLVCLDFNDSIHDGSIKGIISGVELIIQSLEEFSSNKLRSFRQSQEGKTYLQKDLNEKILYEVYKNWSQQKINEYVKNQDKRQKKVKYIR